MLNAFQSLVAGVTKVAKGALEDLDSENENFRKNVGHEKVHLRDSNELTPPWSLGTIPVDNDNLSKVEEQLKKKILELSADERTFTVPPPLDTSFVFDMNAYSSNALSVLSHDDRLNKRRYELVPTKYISIYFYL
jgi:hypothetical protein